MSFARYAIRTAALYALSGQTLVGANVRDSDFGAIDIAADGSLQTDQDRPFIVIFTDDSVAEPEHARDMRQNGALDVVFEFGIASPMTVIDEETGASVIAGVGIPATDAHFEATLDMIDRQLVAALTGDGVWSDIYQGIYNTLQRTERRRVASEKNGVRVAGHQLRFRVDALPDPVWGQPLAAASVWSRFMAALADTDAARHSFAQAFLGPQDEDLTYEHIKRAHGHTASEERSLAYGPADPESPDATIQGHEADETIVDTTDYYTPNA